MKKNLIMLLGIIFIIVFTAMNPNEYQHKEYVKHAFNEVLKIPDVIEIDTIGSEAKSNAYQLGSSFGKLIAYNQIDKNVFVKNYFLFSTTMWQDNYIGFGILNTIFISDDFKERLKDISTE